MFAEAPHYADPLSGVEENLAYNAFLVGKSLLGMRVADVLAAIARLEEKHKPRRIVLCGRSDAALVACLAAAVSPLIHGVACEDMLLILPDALLGRGPRHQRRQHPPGTARSSSGICPKSSLRSRRRKVLIASGIGELPKPGPHVRIIPERFSAEPQRLMEWFDGFL